MILTIPTQKLSVLYISKTLCWAILFFLYTSCKSDDKEYTTTDPITSVGSKYVGTNACIDCHKEEVDKWLGSHHDLAMQIANDSTVLGDFNNVNAEIDGVSYLFFKKNEAFFVKVNELDKTEKEYKVTYTFGVTPLQQYLVDFDKGKKQVLRVTWDVVEKKWYHQYKGARDSPE